VLMGVAGEAIVAASVVEAVHRQQMARSQPRIRVAEFAEQNWSLAGNPVLDPLMRLRMLALLTFAEVCMPGQLGMTRPQRNPQVSTSWESQPDSTGLRCASSPAVTRSRAQHCRA
jgi:hypothetical protein